jgi:hypothetical protein
MEGCRVARISNWRPLVQPVFCQAVFGYYCAAATVAVLGQCGDTLTRANLLDKATHLQKLAVPMLLPGITMSSSPENYSVIRQMQMQRFNGTGWDKLESVVEGWDWGLPRPRVVQPGIERFSSRIPSSTNAEYAGRASCLPGPDEGGGIHVG